MEVSGISAISSSISSSMGTTNLQACSAYSSVDKLSSGFGNAIVNNTSDVVKLGEFLQQNYPDRLSGDNAVSNAMNIMRQDSVTISMLSKKKDNSLILLALALAALNKKDDDEDNMLKALLVAGILGMGKQEQTSMFFSSQQLQTATSTIQNISSGTNFTA